jgi:hypothetical protein
MVSKMIKVEVFILVFSPSTRVRFIGSLSTRSEIMLNLLYE